jgi:hypothetical protein
MRVRLLFAPILATLMVSLPVGFSQDNPKKKGGLETAPPPREKAGPTTPKAPSDLRKYEDVITKEAKSQKGVFDVHQVGEKYYLELPTSAFERLMLWQAEVTKGTGGSSWGGATLGSEVIKFERRGNKVYLWKVGFRKRATGAAIKESVDAASTDSIIAVFPVEAEGKDKSAVITVTNVFMRGLPDLPITGAAGGSGSIDESRSYISKVKAFPTNLEAETLLTFSGGGGFGGFGGPKSGSSGGSKTALVHQSFVVLPEKPMQGRFFDPRVGYFTESFETYDGNKPWTINHQFITRYRLEKKDPNAAVSEVVKPITFYIGREVPEKWKPYMKKGVEDWNSAFEKAGFKNAIVCKYAPTRQEDPNWDAEDARWSVIRWVAEPVANAMGPHVHDPRSGEIISAHIIFWHDVIKLSQMWYFLQVGANDPRAQKLPLPDDLTGDLLRYITTHEVGHSIGLRHNHRASQAYSISQLRDPEFMAKAGPVASIMSYGRFNYVAQPGDGVKHFIPVVGPYDDFAIHWGYAPIKAKSADDEKKTLDEWAAEQIKNPYLRFGGEDGPTSVDPTVLTENIGSDPIEATALGLKNLDKVLGFMLNATTEKGEDFALLEDVYKNLMRHRSNWFGAVAKQVGGVIEYRTLGQRGDETFVRVPKEKQKDSVRFLLSALFTTPSKLLDPKIVNQFKYNGVANDLMAQQKATLNSLLSGSRLNRLFDAEVLAADKAYSVVELVGDLQDGLFSELKDAAPKVDPIRRNLQRAYIDILKKEFEVAPAAGGASPIPRLPIFGDDGGSRVSELRAVARVSLAKLAKQIEAAEPKTKDVATLGHLEDLLSEIKDVSKKK